MIEASVNWTDNERYVGTATSRHSHGDGHGRRENCELTHGISAHRAVRMHRVRRSRHPAKEARAVPGTRGPCQRRTRRRLSGRLYIHSPDLQSPRRSQQEGDGRRGAAFERKILLGFGDARKDGQDYLHNRARRVKAGQSRRRALRPTRCADIFISRARLCPGESRPRSGARPLPGTCFRVELRSPPSIL